MNTRRATLVMTVAPHPFSGARGEPTVGRGTQRLSFPLSPRGRLERGRACELLPTRELGREFLVPAADAFDRAAAEHEPQRRIVSVESGHDRGGCFRGITGLAPVGAREVQAGDTDRRCVLL